jgi:hypothetical protein
MTTEELNFSDFSRIDVQHAIEVEVAQSITYSLSVSVQNIQVKDVNISKEGDKLKIGRRMTPLSILKAPLAKIKVSITMPDLLELTLSGASHGTIRGFSAANDFSLNLNGASHVEMPGMSVGKLEIELSGASGVTGNIKAEENAAFHLAGASKLKLEGSAKDITIDGSGASHAELYNFPIHNANVKLSGASHGAINLDGKLDVKLSGASKLTYVGNPVMGSVDVTGASSFTKA